jgi:hypothetical protein
MPHSHKVNTVTLLAKKFLHLSDEIFHAENFELLTNTLLENGYPRKLIKERIFHVKNPKRLEEVKEKDEKKIVPVPYVKGLKANKPLERTVFSKLKDKTPKDTQSNIIYNIKCECDKNYVG